MINFSYFKQIIKSNYKMLLVFTLVLCMFLIIMSNVFTPTTMKSFGENTSGTIVSNFLSDTTSLVGFMSNSFYALMAIIFPMVYSIFMGHKLIASKIDDASMAGYLATPVTRTKIVISSALYFILSLILMWTIVSIVGIIAANIFQPNALDIKEFLLLNIGCLLYHLVISGICFASSCIFNTSKNSLAFGAGIPLFFFVISLVIKLSSDLDFLKYFTLNTLFDTNNILNQTDYIIPFISMFVMSIILYVIGIIVFKKKDIPL